MDNVDLNVRCFCSRHPLLAVCGRDNRTGEPFIHIKSWKSQRLYTEVVITSGSAHIRCRECLRWHVIHIKFTGVEVKPERLPESIVL